MGNSNAKESRSADNADAGLDGRSERTRNRMSRADLGGFLNLQPASRERDRHGQNAPFERRETRQEREARRLERDRAIRAKERERSMRDEHVDGGFLVTLGTYTGIEDFSKVVVRQLQIERKLAPFWRGLNDWSESWAEHQLVAAARGLPVPPADAPPDADLVPQPRQQEPGSSQSIGGLTVPLGPRTLSAASDRSEHAAGADSQSPAAHSKSTASTAFKPRAKAIAAALSVSSRNASTTDLTPKEVKLPYDPFVNGQPLEVYLYKEATECPICFLSYPPYLNSTRCCDQPICSECFVQIKRADPHLPEHHPDGEARDPNQGLTAEDPPEMLISEPSACPYCQQPEFGVTYEPPHFRRGLVHSTSTFASSTAMSSQSSLTSSPPLAPSHQVARRRGHSLSATAPNVITTDRVRPDWATKLAAARAHQSRRAAAATALHTAAFLMGGNDQRSILRPGRFGRRGASEGHGHAPGNEQSGARGASDGGGAESTEGASSARSPATRRRSRMEELEEMMFMEAVRLSLATEEERKRREEKALRKEAKKRQQAERKAQKKQGSKDPYGGGNSGASASSLSLGPGRKRGGSGASNLRVEATLQGASQASSQSEEAAGHEDQNDQVTGKGKAVERCPKEPLGSASSSTGSLHTGPGHTRSGSHLRQMSNASSLGSSPPDTPSGSCSGQGFVGPDGGGQQAPRIDDADRDAGSEPLFNFRSLAELVGVNIEDGSRQVATAGDGDEGGGEAVTGLKTDAPTQTSSGPLPRVKEEDKEDEAHHVEDADRPEGQETKQAAAEIMMAATDASRGDGVASVASACGSPSSEDAVSLGAPPSEAEHKHVGRSSITERLSTAH
ncbi:C2H2 zinc finger protein [Ophiocordyceps camponoti-floridani]|uniref:C2H2 zinc finger protein n=1 Tax=Ophiocordyceps camponoti-floridani TaxID=2030778 RepID=A0A8H4Q8W5_9HYPO|nr:C2H2 zinc finger protein [Ophiocordyceps camponoti-floridani]